MPDQTTLILAPRPEDVYPRAGAPAVRDRAVALGPHVSPADRPIRQEGWSLLWTVMTMVGAVGSAAFGLAYVYGGGGGWALVPVIALAGVAAVSIALGVFARQAGRFW